MSNHPDDNQLFDLSQLKLCIDERIPEGCVGYKRDNGTIDIFRPDEGGNTAVFVETLPVLENPERTRFAEGHGLLVDDVTGEPSEETRKAVLNWFERGAYDMRRTFDPETGKPRSTEDITFASVQAVNSPHAPENANARLVREALVEPTERARKALKALGVEEAVQYRPYILPADHPKVNVRRRITSEEMRAKVSGITPPVERLLDAARTARDLADELYDRCARYESGRVQLTREQSSRLLEEVKVAIRPAVGAAEELVRVGRRMVKDGSKKEEVETTSE